MKGKIKIAFIILGVILLLIGIVGGIIADLNRGNYKLNLLQQEKLSSIVIKNNINSVEISDNEQVKDIIDILTGKGRITKERSIQDYPINANDIVTVEFHFKGEKSSMLYLYKKNNKFYIEQPYNGIYKISGDEYNSIEKFIK